MKKKVWLTGLSLLAISAGVYVFIHRTQSVDGLLFYQSDCNDCSELFKYCKQHHIEFKNQFDVSNQQNQKYIEQYGLVEVPTLINHGKTYIGTSAIIQFLKAR